MDSRELREKFLKFFEERGHKVIPSASLVPENDPSVLFTTAGMQQFKRFYLKPEESPYSKATSCQKCIRTGDIEEVGDDTHLTFFEMLGNFSFGYPEKEGSYFKKEAIEFGWEFLIKELKFNIERLHATYFNGEGEVGVPADEESKKLIKDITGLSDDKIIGQPFEDNFWSLGTEGSPGGPTVEFYVDGIEVWNLVFNEFVMRNGRYEKSEFQGVDTGMGLERLLTTLNGNQNVYETDLFRPLIQKVEELSGKKYSDYQKEFRIIADHIKTATFAIIDGILPSNKDAGYIVRRLIRRAIVKASQIGIKDNFTIKLADVVYGIYKDVYFCDSERSEESSEARTALRPRSFAKAQDDIKKELEKEENKFRNTLISGLAQFNKWYSWESEKNKKLIPGSVIFDLYQSYGFPSELTTEVAKEKGLTVSKDNIDEFNTLMQKHQELSRTASAGMFKGGLADAGEQAVKYHTATHLLHAALRKVLGEHVQQKGSNITADRMRFDFTHAEKMTPEQIKEVEDLVNKKIQEDLPVIMEEMSPEEAKKSGALGFFEHKYGDKVKVYTIGSSSSTSDGRSEPPFSREICGGPHVTHTGELGNLKILKEESSSAGIRRIKAILE